MIEPRRPCLYWNHLGRQLKMWKTYKVTDSHSIKLLRLWLGYDFINLMDQLGIFRSTDFNTIRKMLGFANIQVMLEEIIKSKSFFLLGISLDKVDAFYSPIWHEYSPEDGQLLNASISQENSQAFDCSKKYIIKNIYPTGGNSVELIRESIHEKESTNNRGLQGGHPLSDNENSTNFRGLQGGRPLSENDNPEQPISDYETSLAQRDHERMYKRRIVREYFQWCEKQTDDDHVAMIDDIKRRIQKPRNHKGEVIKEMILSDAETDEVWNVLIDTQLVPNFADREKFFKTEYMHHPEKRVWWMKAFFSKFASQMLITARKNWSRRKLEIVQSEANAQKEAEMLNRPISPYEWQDPQGARWYITPKGERQPIPAEAEPRPSETSTFNYIKGQWTDSPQPSLVGRE